MGDFFHNVNILKMYVTTGSSPTNVKVTFHTCSFIYLFLEDIKADIDSQASPQGETPEEMRIGALCVVLDRFMFFSFCLMVIPSTFTSLYQFVCFFV